MIHLKRYDLKNVKQVGLLRRPMTLLVTLYCLTIGLTYSSQRVRTQRVRTHPTHLESLRHCYIMTLCHLNQFFHDDDDDDLEMSVYLMMRHFQTVEFSPICVMVLWSTITTGMLFVRTAVIEISVILVPTALPQQQSELR